MISNIAANATTSVASLETDEQSARRIADLIAESFEAGQAAVSLVDKGGGRWLVAIHLGAACDEQAVRALTTLAASPAAADTLRLEYVAAKDWVRESLAGLEPVAAGRFVIHGAHDRARIPINRIGIEIEAALAFGTGHHGTTHGCLIALDRICKSLRCRRAPRILDLGTGSGVLAIAAARALRRRVLATDNDARAVQAARANAALNHVGALVDVVQADGVTARRLRQRAPFDLIFANILLGPLQRFATPLMKLLARDGYLVLSGLLPSQANAAIAAYHALALERKLELDGWATLIFVRRPRGLGRR
ncbi:MAG TPA: 50S ribosomal protein L11 methyltransferase [Xanthobacteraceae bacterium]|jgi:ribosomal protein L11 methyltransferase|nr:50S ribosomal protein L11 methyltransferase [Xanthobacteraceae bacterium]